MIQYEYYFWYQKNVKFGISKEAESRAIEEEWNRLGKDGWKYCCTAWNATIFIREKQITE